MDTNDLIEHLAKEMKPVSRLVSPGLRFLEWLAVAGISIVAGLLITGTRSDLGAKMKDFHFVLESAALMALVIWTGLDSLRLSIPGRGEAISRRWISMGAVLACVFILALGGSTEPNSWFSPGPHFKCSLVILLLSVIPNLLLFNMIRRAFPLDAKNVGVLAGLSSGALAAFGMQFVCTHDGFMHIITWHFLPVLLSGALGFWLASRLKA